jgi:hypothetical protein
MVRIIINLITIALTSFLVIYELTAITDDPIFKVGLLVGAITIEIIIQYDLALGLAYLRLDGLQNKMKGSVLLFFYAWYVLVFALLAGIGFFSAELDTAVTANVTAATANDITVTRSKQIGATLDILNEQLKTETKTGYGPQSRELMAQINSLASEQKNLTHSVKQSNEKIKVDMFSALSSVFGWGANTFKIIIFGTLIAMLYLGQILTAWHIDVTAPVTNFVTADEIAVTSVTDTITNDVTDETLIVCPVCGDSFPSENNKKYCSDKCRQAFWRKSQKKGVSR